MRCCCTSKLGWGFAIVLTVVSVLLGAVVGILHSRFTFKESLHLTYGDTRRIPSYSSIFCEGLKLENSGMPNNLETNLTLYPDLETDKRTVTNAFNTSITGLSLTSYRYHYWKVFLYSDSSLSLEACVLSGKGMEFWMIRNRDFIEWRNDDLDSHTNTFGRISIGNLCTEGPMTNMTIPRNYYEIDDTYYVIFEGMDTSDVNVLNGTLFFEIPEYSTEVESSDHCATGGERVHPCSVSLPLYTSYAVISAKATSLGFHSSIAAVTVTVSCKPRVWVFTLVMIVPVAVVVVIGFVSGCVYWLFDKKLRDHYERVPVRAANDAEVNAGGQAALNGGGQAADDAGGQAGINAGGQAAVNAGGRAGVNGGGQAAVNAGGQAAVNAGGQAAVNAGGQAGVNGGGRAGVNAGGQAADNAGGQAAVIAGGQAGVNAGGQAGINAGGQAAVNAGGQAAVNAGGRAGVNGGGQAGVNAGGQANDRGDVPQGQDLAAAIADNRDFHP